MTAASGLHLERRSSDGAREGVRGGSVACAYVRVLVWCLVAALVCSACSKRFDRTTPEGTIQAAAHAVKNGKAEQLHTFIYAENEEMRKLLARLGRFLGNLQELGEAVQVQFPDEVKELRERSEQAAKDGTGTSLFQQMTQMQRASRTRRPPTREQQNQTRQALDDALKQVFADPYKFLEQSEGRLTTTPINDNTAAVLWDGEAIMPPIGLAMRKSGDGKWYFVLPTNLPGVSSFMPKTKEQYEIFGSLVSVFDKLAKDLRVEVQQGRHKNIDALASSAGEKIFIPAALVFFAYEELRKDQKKAAAPKSEAPATPK